MPTLSEFRVLSSWFRVGLLPEEQPIARSRNSRPRNSCSWSVAPASGCRQLGTRNPELGTVRVSERCDLLATPKLWNFLNLFPHYPVVKDPFPASAPEGFWVLGSEFRVGKWPNSEPRT